MTEGEPHRHASGSEVRDALADVLDHVEERESRSRLRRPDEGSGAVAKVSVVLLGGLAVWLWISPPAFLMPEPLPSPTAQELEDGLRMEMWTAAARVEAYRERTGRLPESLDPVREAPGEFGEISYEPGRRGGFTLSGVRDSVSVTWSSSEGEVALLGDAPQRIRTRGRE